MRGFLAFLLFGFVFAPAISNAEILNGNCSIEDYTILTMNGVFTKEEGAKKNMIALRNTFGLTAHGELINYQYVHNESHLAGIGDILKAIDQKIFDNETVEDYDLVEMLKDASEKVTTRKLLLVAHSQGNFYANSFHDIVSGKDGGVPAESIAVYSVATPSGRVAGGGKHLTSGSDKIISGIVGSTPFRTIMSPNTYIELQPEDDSSGHGFSDIYLKYRGAEIVSDIEESLDKLTTNDQKPTTGSCIDPPKLTLAHKMAGLAFAVADPVSEMVLIDAPAGIYKGSVAILDAGTATVTAIGNATVRLAKAVTSGISRVGQFVLNAGTKFASAFSDAWNDTMSTIANAFSSKTEQVAAVAATTNTGVAELTVNQEDVVDDIPEPAIPDDDTEEELQDEPDEEIIEEEVKPVQLEEETSDTLPPPSVNVGGGTEAPKDEVKTITIETEKTPVKEPVEASEPTSIEYDPNAPSGYYRLSPPGGGGGGVSNSSSDSSESTVAEEPDVEETVVVADTTPPDAPTVSSPSDNAQFTSTSITFSGTAESESVISNSFSSATTSADSSGAWSLTLSLGQGTVETLWYATDDAENISQAATTTVYIDSVDPDITLSSSTCDGTLSSSSCLVTTTSLSFSWSSSASDLAHFVISKNGTVSTTTETSTTVTSSDESTYTFSILAVDTSGNTSATSTQAVISYALPVVINEVAWGGTEASAFDEWVELYNRTEEPISLSNFVMYSSDMSPYIPLSGTISGESYFLIERTNDTTVSTVTADLVTTFSGDDGSGLSNDGDALTLAYIYGGATTTVDSMPTCPGGNTAWCDGSSFSGDRKTMERYSVSAAGSSSSNWDTHLGEFILNGEDANGTAIKGTPKARNSISYLVSGTGNISSDQTLTSANSPYLIGRTSLTVSAGATLTIDPGVVIKIVNNASPWIDVEGTLRTNGTAAEPVVFTSFYDDDYGGDMNTDGTATTPSAGNWVRIFFDTTSGGSSLTHTLVRYGGGNSISDATKYRGAIGVDSANVSFNNLTVENSNSHGVSLFGSDSTITDSNFSTSTNTTFSSSGVSISGGSPTITGSNFTGNYRGITVSASNSTINSNTFINNLQEAVYTSGVIGSFSGNSGSGNSYNAIMIAGSSDITSAGATTTLSANDLSYVVKGTVTVVADSTLEFGSGAVVKGWDSVQSKYGLISVESGGSLYTAGTTASDIVFTSIRDSSVGGEVKSGSAAPAAGAWKGISVDAGGSVNMSGFTMKYGGASAHLGSGKNGGAFKITGSTATSSGSISNALFSNNYQSGLNINTVSAFSVSSAAFEDHTAEYTDDSTGIYTVNSTATFSDLTFSGNNRDGVGSGTNTLTCTNCGSPNTSPADLLSP